MCSTPQADVVRAFFQQVMLKTAKEKMEKKNMKATKRKGTVHKYKSL